MIAVMWTLLNYKAKWIKNVNRLSFIEFLIYICTKRKEMFLKKVLSFTCLSSFSSNLIILVFPRQRRSSFPIRRLNLLLTELASRAPSNSSKVALSCKIQSNLNISFSSGSEVVFLRSFRITAVLVVLSHRLSRSDTFWRYSSMRQFRWYSFWARRQWVATYFIMISAIGRPVMSN